MPPEFLLFGFVARGTLKQDQIDTGSIDVGKDEVAIYISTFSLIVAGLSWWANARSADAAEESANAAKRSAEEASRTRREGRLLEIGKEANLVIALTIELDGAVLDVRNTLRRPNVITHSRARPASVEAEEAARSVGTWQQEAREVIDHMAALSEKSDEDLRELLTELQGRSIHLRRKIASLRATASDWLNGS